MVWGILGYISSNSRSQDGKPEGPSGGTWETLAIRPEAVRFVAAVLINICRGHWEGSGIKAEAHTLPYQ